MVKNLSAVIMDVWVRSSESECVKRLSQGNLIAIRVGRKCVGEIPLNRKDRLSILRDEEIVCSHMKV